MTDQFWESDTIKKRYENRGELGKGGIGTVYRAHDFTLDKLVAIKVLNSNLSSDQLRRFQQEGKISGKLKHRNIVTVIDFGVTEDNQPYLVMEYLPGKSLAQVIADNGRLELDQAISIFIEICGALAHSHDAGIFHRDLKPENVILTQTESGETCVKVVDFGLARVTEVDAHITQTGAMVGSPLYMSPEQCDGKAADSRSDVYAMGCLMYCALTGQPPFVGNTPIETVMLHRSATAESLSRSRGMDFPDEVENIVRICLMKEPNDRYQKFEALAEQLEQLDYSSIPELFEKEAKDPVELPQPKKPPLSRTMVALIAALVPLVVLICGLAFRLGDESAQVRTIVNKRSKKKQDVVEKMKEANRQAFVVSRDKVEGGLQVDKVRGDVTDDDLTQLSKYPAINMLNVTKSLINGSGFAELSKTRVSTILLDGTPLTDDGLKLVAKVPGLNKLAIRDTDSVTANGLKHLVDCQTLTGLLFGGSQLNEESFKVLSKGPPNLLKLQPKRMRITLKGMATLATMKALEQLQFQACDVDPTTWSALSQVKTLKYLCVSGPKNLSREDLAAIFAVRVRELGLYDVSVAPEDLDFLLTANSRLTTVRVDCPGSTEAQRERVKRLLNCKEANILGEALEEIIGPGEVPKFEMEDIK